MEINKKILNYYFKSNQTNNTPFQNVYDECWNNIIMKVPAAKPLGDTLNMYSSSVSFFKLFAALPDLHGTQFGDFINNTNWENQNVLSLNDDVYHAFSLFQNISLNSTDITNIKTAIINILQNNILKDLGSSNCDRTQFTKDFFFATMAIQFLWSVPPNSPQANMANQICVNLFNNLFLGWPPNEEAQNLQENTIAIDTLLEINALINN